MRVDHRNVLQLRFDDAVEHAVVRVVDQVRFLVGKLERHRLGDVGVEEGDDLAIKHQFVVVEGVQPVHEQVSRVAVDEHLSQQLESRTVQEIVTDPVDDVLVVKHVGFTAHVHGRRG